MSPLVVQCAVHVEPGPAEGDVTVTETFVEIEHREELKVVAQGAVEAGVKSLGSTARLAELPDSAAALRAVAGAAALNGESVAGKCAAACGHGAVFREAVGAEEASPRGEAGAPRDFLRG